MASLIKWVEINPKVAQICFKKSREMTQFNNNKKADSKFMSTHCLIQPARK